MSINQNRVGLRGGSEWVRLPRGLLCPSIRTASASAAHASVSSSKLSGGVHQSEPRRPPRPALDDERVAAHGCPSIRTASASAAVKRRNLIALGWGVHQSEPRRPPRPRRDRIVPPRHRVSINQNRVGLRGTDIVFRGAMTERCPSIRTASASAASIFTMPRRSLEVSINQNRVGLRGSIASAVPARIARVHQSEPRRPPRLPAHTFPSWQARVHQSEPRRPPRPRTSTTTTAKPSRVHQSEPRRPPRRPPLKLIHHSRCSVHQSEPRRPPRPSPTVEALLDAVCPSIRTASASAALAHETELVVVVCVHQSEPRRPPRRSWPRWGLRASARVHQSEPRRPPRLPHSQPPANKQLARSSASTKVFE